MYCVVLCFLVCIGHNRLQAWWRWINKGDNGVPPQRRKGLFADLKRLADSERLVKYNKRFTRLRKSADWLSNTAFQTYYRDEWDSCKELWLASYRQASCCCMVAQHFCDVCA